MKTDKAPPRPTESNGSEPDRTSESLLVAMLVAALPQAERERLTRELAEWQVSQASIGRRLRTLQREMLEQRAFDDVVHLMEFGHLRLEYRFSFSDDKPGARPKPWQPQYLVGSTASARTGDTDAARTDRLGDALTAGFSDAVAAAIGKAHSAGLAVPGREQGKPVERRPDGRTVSIDDKADWSPTTWKRGT